MKIQLETIAPDTHRCFQVMHNPRLNDFFFWHFHPEFELVYIETQEGGIRHVGDHLSRYPSHDLVLIGSNVPHLNFDYGLKTQYEKVVIHARPDFLERTLAHTPDLVQVKNLFEQSYFGVAFGEATQANVATLFKTLHTLAPFEQFLTILHILYLLADAPDRTLLHKKPFDNPLNRKEQERLQRLYKYIDAHYQRKISIDEVAELSYLSNPAFCRYFKKMTRLTFTEFLNQYRVNKAQQLLLLDKNVSEVCFECGFESLSYFNRTFKKITQQNPLAFKKRFLGQ